MKYEIRYTGLDGCDQTETHEGNETTLQRLKTFLEERGAQMIATEILDEDAEVKINPNLIPYRVMLNEEPGDKFLIVFDCMAEDDDQAVEQAEQAYPGCDIISYLPFDNAPLSYVIYSANESATSDGAGFWSNEHGWTIFDQATTFSSTEKLSFSLPISTGQDAKWVLFDEAKANFSTEAKPGL